MALASATISFPSTSISSFHEHLKSSKRIMALLGAGLSASSGLSTYRGVGANGLWNGHKCEDLANPKAFAEKPHLVWDYHQERREEALNAEPNAAHQALAKLAGIKGPKEFLAVSMNVDGLCTRAEHPKYQLLEVHGSLFDMKCSGSECDYVKEADFGANVVRSEENGSLPQCPKCTDNILRPGIVWFGEPLRKEAVEVARAYLEDPEPIDLMLVIGTTAQVWPSAGFVDDAIEKGARVAMVNLDRGDLVPEGGALGLTHRDWFFVGDSAGVVPKLLEHLVGRLPSSASVSDVSDGPTTKAE